MLLLINKLLLQITLGLSNTLELKLIHVLYCIFYSSCFTEWFPIPRYSRFTKIPAQAGKAERKNSFLLRQSCLLVRASAKVRNKILRVMQTSKRTVLSWWHSRDSLLNSTACKEITRKKKKKSEPTDLNFADIRNPEPQSNEGCFSYDEDPGNVTMLANYLH